MSSSASTGGSSVVDDDGWTKVGRDVLTPVVKEKEKGKGKKDVPVKDKDGEEERKTLAEKMLPKPAPTAVDECVRRLLSIPTLF